MEESFEDSFQQRVYQQLAAIAPGRVISYGRLAELAGCPGGARAVGRCLRELPSDTHLPWHRVVKSTGELAFPKTSRGAERQRKRLAQEGIELANNRCSMAHYGV